MLVDKCLTHHREVLISAKNTVESVAHLTGPLLSGFCRDMFRGPVFGSNVVECDISQCWCMTISSIILVHLKKM